MKTLNEISHDLQQMAMNVPCRPDAAKDGSAFDTWERNYRFGHRDARHAIAEAVTAYFVELIESGAKLTEKRT